MKKELLNRIQTDTSGKWINLENAEKLIELTIQECIKVADKCREDEWFDVSGAIEELLNDS